MFRWSAIVEPCQAKVRRVFPRATCSPVLHRASQRRCRSSVVEHSLGKGEVDSSILSGSTSPAAASFTNFADRSEPPCAGMQHGMTSPAAADRRRLNCTLRRQWTPAGPKERAPPKRGS